MCDTELAWAAGLFDGEGWVSVNRRYRNLEVGIGQKDRRVLDRFRAAVGAGSVYAERANTFFGYRAANAADQLHVLRSLWPYLSAVKRSQARVALRALRENRQTLTRRVSAVEEIYDELEGVIGEA